MGSGKSFWGRKWADKFNFRFIDLDEVIENQTGETILQIFEKEGETAFRHLERKTLENLVNEKDVIIACGGGTPCFFDNIQMMNNHGKTVYLKASANQIISRISLELHKRPLLKNLNDDELKSFIDDKLKEREPYYFQATITVPVDAVNENSIQSFINA